MRRINSGGASLRGLAWEAVLQSDLLAQSPAQEDALWIRFHPPPGIFERLSYSEALERPEGYFRGKHIFVGSRPATPRLGDEIDVFRTPWNRWTGQGAAGVEIQATIFLNLVREEWLRRPAFFSELAVLLLAGFAWGFGLRLISPRAALAAGALGGLVIAFSALALPWVTRLWFPWMIIVAVQIPLALVWSLASALKEYRADLAQVSTPSAESTNREAPLAPAPNTSGVPVAKSDQAGSETPPIPDHRLLKRIGAGAYGEVWLAENVVGSLHAVKIIQRHTFADAAPYEREFRGIQRFMPISRGHPNLVNVLHAGRRDDLGFFFYIMEAADSVANSPREQHPFQYQPRTLSQELTGHKRLPLHETLRIASAIGWALDYLHRNGLVHRDIKPANVIFVNGVAKLADIGLVTQTAARGRQVTYLGTQGYIAPEGPGTPGADIFSLGKVLYEMITGLDRLQFPDLPTFILDRPDELPLVRLNQIILKACDSDARRRYQAASQLAQDLEALAAEAKKIEDF